MEDVDIFTWFDLIKDVKCAMFEAGKEGELNEITMNIFIGIYFLKCGG